MCDEVVDEDEHERAQRKESKKCLNSHDSICYESIWWAEWRWDERTNEQTNGRRVCGHRFWSKRGILAVSDFLFYTQPFTILNVSSLSVVFVRRKYFLIWFGGNLAALRGATLPFSCDLRFAENVQISPHKLFSGRKCLRGRFHCDNRICEWSGGWMNRSRTMGFENLLGTEFTSPAPMEMLNCFGWIRWPTLSFPKCNNALTKKTVYCLAKWVNNTDCNSSRNQMLI